ncbi:MAG: hypothetical protein MUD08_14380, partial [Cytophagales bacterium]|nr:hypothetical protein [Cytophagales bacterium]
MSKKRLKREPLVSGEPVVPAIPPCGKTCVQKRFGQKTHETQKRLRAANAPQSLFCISQVSYTRLCFPIGRTGRKVWVKTPASGVVYPSFVFFHKFGNPVVFGQTGLGGSVGGASHEQTNNRKRKQKAHSWGKFYVSDETPEPAVAVCSFGLS